MENQTTFDLNQQLIAWRENLAQSPAFGSENLDELENHLRDSIGRLQAGGLSEEEAFGVAMKRVGAVGSLAGEFGKVNPQAVWIERLFWMLVGLQLWIFVHDLLSQIALSVQINFLHAFLQVGPNGLLWNSVDLLAMAASIGICWWLIMRQGPAVASWINRSSPKKVERLWAVLILGFVVVDYLPDVIPQLYFMAQLNHGPYDHFFGLANSFYYLIYPVGQALALLLITVSLARKRVTLRKAG